MQFNHNSSEEQSECSEEDDHIQSEKTSKKIFKVALEIFNNQQYKKTIKFLEPLILDTKTSYYWQILFLRLTSYQEIIEKKLNSYYYNINKILNIEKYLKNFTKCLNTFITEVNKNKNDKYFSSKYEIIITLLLRQCINYARFCIYQNYLFDSIGFLGLGERLIKNSSDFICSPDSFHYACDIYIFLSSLYIISDNFDTAKRYIILCLKLSYKELELRLENNDYLESLININNCNEKEKEKIENIFLKISICFFHLGVCNENEYNYDSAYESYKQAKWFGNAIPNKSMVEFLVTLYNMEKRELLRDQIFKFFKKEAHNLIEEPLKSIIPKPKIIYKEKDNIQKFEILEKYLENLKIKEIDDDEPDLLNNIKGKPFTPKVGNTTKTIHVLNYLMENKFNNIIDKMKKIELHKLSEGTKEIIQKQIIRIKNDQREKERKSNINENKKEENNITNSNNYSNNIFIYNNNNTYNSDIQELKENELMKKKIKNIKLTNRVKHISKLKLKKSYLNNNSTESSNYSTINNHKNHIILTNESIQYTNKNLNASRIKSYSRSSITSKNKTKISKKIKNDKVERMDFDHFIFSKKFRDKISFLDNQFGKEIKFQKDLLNSKVVPNDYVGENFNGRKVKLNCEDFFKSTLKKEIQLAEEREILKEEQNLKAKKDITSSRFFKRIPSSKIMKRKYSIKIIKKNSTPKIENMKFIDTLTNQIDEINNTKYYLLKSYKRDLKKNDRK